MSGPALCGPTNALTSLQKHTFQDRQLQQDRLRSQASGPLSFQNFRANTNLNSEFDQFASAPSPFALAVPHPPTPTANWAADFQRLHISQPPQPQTSFRPAPLVPRSTPWGQQQNGANWAAEFMRSQTATPAAPVMAAPIHQQQTQFSSQIASVGNTYTTQSTQGTQYEGLGSYYDMMSEGGQAYESDMWASSSMAPVATTSQQFQPVVADQVSDAAFDAAFAEAYRWTLESTQQDELDAISASPKIDKGKGREIVVDMAAPTPRHIDAVEEEKADGEQVKDKDDSDELSKTAGQLLDSLATNRSEKFQQSNFLALMRKLRDKEVKVEGEKMVEVNASG